MVKLVVADMENDKILVGQSPRSVVKMLQKFLELTIIGKHVADIESYLWVIIILILYILSIITPAK